MKFFLLSHVLQFNPYPRCSPHLLVSEICRTLSHNTIRSTTSVVPEVPLIPPILAPSSLSPGSSNTPELAHRYREPSDEDHRDHFHPLRVPFEFQHDARSHSIHRSPPLPSGSHPTILSEATMSLWRVSILKLGICSDPPGNVTEPGTFGGRVLRL